MLRDYQQEMLDRINDAWSSLKSVLVQMPTGTGKTVLMAELIKHEECLDRQSGGSTQVASHAKKAKQGMKNTRSCGVLVVAHRIELIAQIAQTLEASGIEHGLIVSGMPVDGTKRVQVASIQTLAKRIETMDFSPELVIVDEAHHALARTYRMLWEQWPEARFLGLTATPCRLNNAPFTDLFDVLLQSWSIQTFIDKGWLSDFDYVSASPDSDELHRIATLQKRGADGDYQTKEMATVMDCQESIAHLYDTYQAFANGRKGIVYAIDRQHARHIAAYYEEQGVRCAVIDSMTPARERQQMIEDYRLYGPHHHDKPHILINVDIFSEGFDCPEVEFIQLARPTLSLAKYLQQVGRGMRISAGKEAVMILDQVGLYQTFGLPTEERDWQLTFMGKLSGKGQQGTAHPVVLKDDVADEKELMNLDMVRIRRRSDSLKGLAVYLQGGMYGIMKDGNMTTQPVFEKVWRCKQGPFYALATYPYAFYKNRTTVIDLQGIDQMVKLYGQIQLKGDFLYGDDGRGETILWDTVGKKYYRGREPEFERFGGLDLLRIDNDRNARTQYELRYTRGLQSFLFDKEEVLYNNYIAIIRDMLIIKSNGYRVFKIFGYMNDSVLICSKKQYEILQVTWDGHIEQKFRKAPVEYSLRPDYRRLRLRN